MDSSRTPSLMHRPRNIDWVDSSSDNFPCDSDCSTKLNCFTVFMLLPSEHGHRSPPEVENGIVLIGRSWNLQLLDLSTKKYSYLKGKLKLLTCTDATIRFDYYLNIEVRTSFQCHAKGEWPRTGSFTSFSSINTWTTWWFPLRRNGTWELN